MHRARWALERPKVELTFECRERDAYHLARDPGLGPYYAPRAMRFPVAHVESSRARAGGARPHERTRHGKRRVGDDR
jgi:hypothetical protein